MKTIKPVYKYVTILLLLSTAALLAFSWEIDTGIEYVWNMDSSEEFITTNMTGTVHNGIFEGHTSGILKDPYMCLCVNELTDIRLDADEYSILSARIYLDESIPDKSVFCFFFRADDHFAKHSFPAHKGWHEYRIDMTVYPKWKGEVDSFRLDFVEGISSKYEIKIDSIEFSRPEQDQSGN